MNLLQIFQQYFRILFCFIFFSVLLFHHTMKIKILLIIIFLIPIHFHNFLFENWPLTVPWFIFVLIKRKEKYVILFPSFIFLWYFTVLIGCLLIFILTYIFWWYAYEAISVESYYPLTKHESKVNKYLMGLTKTQNFLWIFTLCHIK